MMDFGKRVCFEIERAFIMEVVHGIYGLLPIESQEKAVITGGKNSMIGVLVSANQIHHRCLASFCSIRLLSRLNNINIRYHLQTGERISGLSYDCLYETEKALFITYCRNLLNDYVRNRLQSLAGVQEPLLQNHQKFGHVTRHNNTILQGTVEDSRRRSRQKKNRIDNIKDWTNMSIMIQLRSTAADRQQQQLLQPSSPPPPFIVRGLNQ